MSASRDWTICIALITVVVVLILSGLLRWLEPSHKLGATHEATATSQSTAQTRRLASSPGRSKATARPRSTKLRRESTGPRADMSDTQLALLDFLLRMKSGEQIKLTREEVDEWLRVAGRTAANLVAAEQLINDPALLAEAARNFPNDPHVQMEVLLKDAFPEARQRWIEAFKLSAPDNALANYLAAREMFKTGKPEAAMQELRQAALKPGLDTFALDLEEVHQSAWTSAGYPLAAAQMMSLLGSQTPAIGAFNEVAAQTADLAAKYRQSGDGASAEAMASAGLMLAHRVNDRTPTIIQELVGMGIENKFLQQMSPDAMMPGGVQTVAARQAFLKERQESVVGVMKSFDETAVTRLSDEDIHSYFDRVHTDGGYEALNWLRGRMTPP